MPHDDNGGGVKIEAVIGGWIAQRREDTGLTQSQVGDELGKYLGKPWSRQAVSAAEKGRRSFTAAELVAFAVVLGCSVESLLEPPADVAAVVLADGSPMDSRHLRGHDATSSNESLSKLLQTFSALRAEFPSLLATAQHVDDLLDDAALELWATARGRGVDSPSNLLDLPARSDNAPQEPT